MPGDQSIMTTPTNSVEEDALLLYEPVAKQISPRKIPWTEKPERITPQQAQVILREADEYSGFGQRKRTPARVKRWLTLMESNRFVDYMPFGPLGFNEDGIVMNGGNRLAAVAEHSSPVGFIVLR